MLPFKNQDCKLKGAYRLLKRLKSHFPQLKICLLGDNIYFYKNHIYLLTIALTLNQLYEKGILSKDEQRKFNRKIITVTFLMYFCSVLFR